MNLEAYYSYIPWFSNKLHWSNVSELKNINNRKVKVCECFGKWSKMSKYPKGCSRRGRSRTKVLINLTGPWAMRGPVSKGLRDSSGPMGLSHLRHHTRMVKEVQNPRYQIHLRVLMGLKSARDSTIHNMYMFWFIDHLLTWQVDKYYSCIQIW